MFKILSVLLICCASIPPCQILNCETCSSFSSLICNNCELDYTRTLEGCLSLTQSRQDLIENCISYNNEKSCTLCKFGFKLELNSCQPECDDNCICLEPNICLDSNQLLNLNSARLNERRLPYCYNCDECSLYSSLCLTCSDGYYNNQGYCYSCIKNCKECYNYYSCSECKSGYKYDSDEVECKSKSSSINITVIIGGSVGGFVGLIILIIVIYYCVKNGGCGD